MMKMNSDHRKAALRIAAVSVLLAASVSPLAWFLGREVAEESTVFLAIEESRKLAEHSDAFVLEGESARQAAREAAERLIGGLFDIAELYDRSGTKLAEATTDAGEAVESELPPHHRPDYVSASYESLTLADDRWVMRVMVPFHADASTDAAVTGYFEGVRIVPAWQQAQIHSSSLRSAVISAVAALLCGLVLFPVVVRLSTENARKAREVLESHISMMDALGRAIAKRDSDTGAHNYRVAWLAARIGESMGLHGQAMQVLIVGSFLHDVGKIGIPDAILLKPGRLDADEMAVMRTHVAQGEEVVADIGWLDGARAVVASHHEKWDGSGYPRGLAGEAIPLAARIFAVADVFDALSSRRPYKAPMPFDKAMGILRADRGTHFDPAVIDCFERLAPELVKTLGDGDEAHARKLLEARVAHHFGL